MKLHTAALTSLVTSALLGACALHTTDDSGAGLTPTPGVTLPCPDAVLHSRQTYTACSNGLVTYMEEDNWCCPDGTTPTTDSAVGTTDTACGDAQADGGVSTGNGGGSNGQGNTGTAASGDSCTSLDEQLQSYVEAQGGGSVVYGSAEAIALEQQFYGALTPSQQQTFNQCLVRTHTDTAGVGPSDNGVGDPYEPGGSGDPPVPPGWSLAGTGNANGCLLSVQVNATGTPMTMSKSYPNNIITENGSTFSTSWTMTPGGYSIQNGFGSTVGNATYKQIELAPSCTLNTTPTGVDCVPTATQTNCDGSNNANGSWTTPVTLTCNNPTMSCGWVSACGAGTNYGFTPIGGSAPGGTNQAGAACGWNAGDSVLGSITVGLDGKGLGVGVTLNGTSYNEAGSFQMTINCTAVQSNN